MRKGFLLLLTTLLALFALSACNLVSQQEIDEINNATATANALTRPTVVINSPPNGTEVIVNTQVIVSVTATDNIGLTRVVLSVNNQQVELGYLTVAQRRHANQRIARLHAHANGQRDGSGRRIPRLCRQRPGDDHHVRARESAAGDGYPAAAARRADD